MDIKADIIDLIASNRISTTEVADVLGKKGQIPGVRPLTPGLFAVGEVVVVYAINNSNYEVHKQLAEIDCSGKILYVHNVNCDRAIFGDLVTKYIMLYKHAKAIVVNGILRDAHTLVKEKYPIWLEGVSPIGCVNKQNGPDISAEELSTLRERYDGSIFVCDDSGVVMIPREAITPEIIQRLNFIEYQEDIWFYCLDTLKMSTYDIVCKKKYMDGNIFDKETLKKLSEF